MAELAGGQVDEPDGLILLTRRGCDVPPVWAEGDGDDCIAVLEGPRACGRCRDVDQPSCGVLASRDHIPPIRTPRYRKDGTVRNSTIVDSTAVSDWWNNVPAR